jgi:hypothetical protein
MISLARIITGLATGEKIMQAKAMRNEDACDIRNDTTTTTQ